MKQVCSLACKAGLALFLMCAGMLFIVDYGTAEWVIMVLSCVLMGALVALSALLLRKKEKEEPK